MPHNIKIKFTKPESALCVMMYIIPKNKITAIGMIKFNDCSFEYVPL